jgi:hypothetical protein
MEYLCLKHIVKKITFSSRIIVILIPTRLEYIKLGNSLWWEKDDYKNFKKSACIEINNMIQRNPLMSPKHVMKLLYQPNNITFDESNF